MDRKDARIAAGFRTQRGLAKKLGVRHETVNRYETGARKVPAWYDWLLELAVEVRKVRGENERARRYLGKAVDGQ